MKRPLEGIRVLDLTQAYSGPFCTMNLADHGAEVIKIEVPNLGDQTRTWGPIYKGCSGYYSYVNRNKKGMTLNLKSEEGKKIFTELLKNAGLESPFEESCLNGVCQTASEWLKSYDLTGIE